MADFIKLKELVDKSFTVRNVGQYKYKFWDSGENRMVVFDSYQEGARKLYPVETDKGTVDMGSGQLGSLLEAVFYKGQADLTGKTFSVKSNGKTGIDIRYTFTAVKAEPVDQPPADSYNEAPF